MITLQTDQPVLNLPQYLVKNGGDYNENDLVEVYIKDQPEQTVSFFAIFIATGQNP